MHRLLPSWRILVCLQKKEDKCTLIQNATLACSYSNAFCVCAPRVSALHCRPSCLGAATSLFSRSVTSSLGDIMLGLLKHPLVHVQATLTHCRIHKNLRLSVSHCGFTALHFAKGVDRFLFQKGLSLECPAVIMSTCIHYTCLYYIRNM